MVYTAKNYDRLLGIQGFSDKLLKAHFKLYEGYVTHINEMIEFFQAPEALGPGRDEVRRRFPWEFNGMRLHEAYFGNMTKQHEEIDPESNLAGLIVASFGSLKAWETDFRAVSAMRGVGWAVLAWDPEGRNLFNIWINEHDVGHLFYSVALLVNDVFEHAYITDYGVNRKDYIEAFMKVIDWTEVEKRFSAVVQLSQVNAR